MAFLAIRRAWRGIELRLATRMTLRPGTSLSPPTVEAEAAAAAASVKDSIKRFDVLLHVLFQSSSLHNVAIYHGCCEPAVEMEVL